MVEEQHFQYFRMSKYHFDDLLHPLSPYIQHQNTHCNPLGVLQRTAVALWIIWVITIVCSSSWSSKPSLLQAYFFFSSASSGPIHLSGNDRTHSAANQSKCGTNQNDVCDVTSFDNCKTLTTHSQVFLHYFCLKTLWTDNCPSSIKQALLLLYLVFKSRKILIVLLFLFFLLSPHRSVLSK